jgi:general secretion pathway protein I
VVVALAILAAGILAVLDLFSGSLRLTGGARDVAAAQVYASQRMEEALLAPHPVPGVDRGDFGDKYRWETTTTREPAEADEGFREVRIRVTVSWDDGPRERAVAITASRWERKPSDEQG